MLVLGFKVGEGVRGREEERVSAPQSEASELAGVVYNGEDVGVRVEVTAEPHEDVSPNTSCIAKFAITTSSSSIIFWHASYLELNLFVGLGASNERSNTLPRDLPGE